VGDPGASGLDPPWKTVYQYFRLWRLDGTCEELNSRLRAGARSQSGREATPSAGIMDSQSAKTTDKGKSVGMTLARVKVHESDIDDKEGAKLLLVPLMGILPRMANRGVAGWVEARLGWELKVVKHWWSGIKWCGCHRGKNLQFYLVVFMCYPGGGSWSGPWPG
jgi:putative transposase